MLCSVCQLNEAKVHLAQVVNGKVQKIDLCESCSQEKGVSDTAGYALAEMLLGISGAKPAEEKTSGGGKSQLRCPACGFTQADFKKTARLGCPECYETFAEPLAGMLKSMHRGTKHTGKAPHAPPVAHDPARQLLGLQGQLEEAVLKEDFERAARLRDQIKELKGRLQTPAATPP
jgi:protein arginine kinase activator